VSNPTSPTSENKPRGPTVGWLARLIQAAGDRLFAANDREAGWHGWEVTRYQGGLGRGYRDPRFDTLMSCPLCGGSGAAWRDMCGGSGAAWRDMCGGSGVAGRDACVRCGGTGRTVRAVSRSESGRP